MGRAPHRPAARIPPQRRALAGPHPAALQLSFLKDQTSPAYYYTSPINNGAAGSAG